MTFHKFILIRVVIALGLSMIIGWGTIFYAFGILGPKIISETGMSRGFVYGCFSAALIASGLVAPGAGRLIDRLGGRRVMTIGSLVATLGFLLLTWSPNMFVYAIGWIVVGSAIPFTLYDPAFATVTAVAGSQKARALIVQITLFGGLASTVFWPLTHMLDSQIGWRNTWLVYAALNLFVCAPLHFFALPSHKLEDSAQPPAASTPDDRAPWLSADQRPLAMLMMAILFASNNFMLSGLSAHLMPLLGDLGLSAAQAVALGALIGPSQVAGRLIELVFGRNLSPVMIGWLATSLLIASLAAASMIGVAGHAGVLFAIGYGCANGLITISRGTLPLVLFGRAGFGATLGKLARPSLAVAAIAPFVFALIIETWQANAGLLVSIAAAFVSWLAMTAIALRYGFARRRV